MYLHFKSQSIIIHLSNSYSYHMKLWTTWKKSFSITFTGYEIPVDSSYVELVAVDVG